MTTDSHPRMAEKPSEASSSPSYSKSVLFETSSQLPEEDQCTDSQRGIDRLAKNINAVDDNMAGSACRHPLRDDEERENIIAGC